MANETIRAVPSGWAIRLIHFNAGWRYWAFRSADTQNVDTDARYGLNPGGYSTEDEAIAAVKFAAARLSSLEAA